MMSTLSSVGETKDNLSASLFARYTLGIEPGDGEKLITSIMKDDGKGGLLTYNDLVEGDARIEYLFSQITGSG